MWFGQHSTALPAAAVALLIGTLLIALGLAARRDSRGACAMLILLAPIGMLAVNPLGAIFDSGSGPGRAVIPECSSMVVASVLAVGAQFCLDKETAAMFALAWGLAARSPHTIVYLPLRRAELPTRHVWGRPLDLVLLHHRLAFPPSRWKQVRSRLETGRPHSVVLPPHAWPTRSIADHQRAWHQLRSDQV